MHRFLRICWQRYCFTPADCQEPQGGSILDNQLSCSAHKAATCSCKYQNTVAHVQQTLNQLLLQSLPWLLVSLQASDCSSLSAIYGRVPNLTSHPPLLNPCRPPSLRLSSLFIPAPQRWNKLVRTAEYIKLLPYDNSGLCLFSV